METNNFVELKSCPICDGNGRIVDQVRTIHPGSDMELDLMGCTECGHWWTTPMPTQDYLNELYTSASEFVVPKAWGGDIGYKVFSSVEKYIMKKEPQPDGRKYLEIGVGAGHLLRHFMEQGWQAYGVEPGEWCSMENVFGDISSIPDELGFDVIVGCDVLEHVERPVEMLSALRRLANPDARLYCSFPNCDSLHARLKEGRWRMVRPLGHLHYFSEDSAKIALERSGWTLDGLKQVGTIDMGNWANLSKPRTVLVGLAELLGLADQWMCEARS